MGMGVLLGIITLENWTPIGEFHRYGSKIVFTPTVEF